MAVTVEKTSKSRQDVLEQAQFIALDNPAAAFRFVDAVEETFQMLAEMPGMGSKRDYRRVKGLRMFPVNGFETHLVFYRPLKNGVKILRIIYSSQNIESIFA